jgi:cell division protein FtsQ
VLEAPEKLYASAPAPRQSAPSAGSPRRVAKVPALRRDTSDDFARRSAEADTDAAGFPRPRGLHFNGLRFRLKGSVPTSLFGRIVGGLVVLGGLAGFTAVLWGARAMLLASPELTIRSSSSIQITGNEHLTRPQLLSVFGDDVDRNILTVSLEDRRAQLEQLPWVEHATVMRLLPNKLRVAIVERTPVAFVRQGQHISLVDKTGVLLDISPDAPAANHYSFPVVTGINQDDPLSTRAARMALFERFQTELDSGTDKVSQTLSEVDLSSPEDVKALIATGDGPGASDILVHFGSENFLTRYQKFKQRLPEWKTQYPRLASVDMRYDRQVVLEMAPGAAAPAEPKTAASPTPAAKTARPAKPAPKARPKATAKPTRPVARPAHPAAAHPAVKPSQAGPQ